MLALDSVQIIYQFNQCKQSKCYLVTPRVNVPLDQLRGPLAHVAISILHWAGCFAIFVLHTAATAAIQERLLASGQIHTVALSNGRAGDDPARIFRPHRVCAEEHTIVRFHRVFAESQDYFCNLLTLVRLTLLQIR